MIFIMGTIIILFMVYKQIESSIAFKLGIAYVCLTFFLVLYVPFITILNSRKLKWGEIRVRLLRLIFWLVLFAILNYIIDYAIRPSKIDLFREVSSAFGAAFGISFVEVTFLKKQEK